MEFISKIIIGALVGILLGHREIKKIITNFNKNNNR